MSKIKKTIQTNPKAPYVIRNIAIGSEPLFDGVLPVDQLASVIKSTREDLRNFGTQVSLSDMPYGFQKNGNAPQIFEAIDILEVKCVTERV